MLQKGGKAEIMNLTMKGAEDIENYRKDYNHVIAAIDLRIVIQSLRVDDSVVVSSLPLKSLQYSVPHFSCQPLGKCLAVIKLVLLNVNVTVLVA